MHRTSNALAQAIGIRSIDHRLPREHGGTLRRGRFIGAALLALAVAASIAGCAVGPNYKRPSVETPTAYRDAPVVVPADSGTVADLPWWKVFGDPVLEGLIDESLVSSYDMQIVASRVEQARYAVGTTRADLFPQFDYRAEATRGRSINPFSVDGADTTNLFFAAFQMAWEVDIWGRVRRATEASLADLLAAEDVQRGVILSLVTSVAQAYFELRELDLELEIAKRTRVSFQETYDLFDRRFRGGVGNKLATSRAAAALANAAASIPQLEQRILAKENQICILVGRNPGPIPRGAVLTEQAAVPDVSPGLPAELLERRPDVRQAEQNVVATNALVGVAVGNFLPRVGLGALYGGQSSEIEDIFNSSSKAWQIGGGFLGPLFQGGRLYYGYKGSKAAREEAVLNYKYTVLTALGEVSDAMTAREKVAQANVELQKQVVALQEAVRLALTRYDSGLAGYYEVLDAQQQLFPAENALARNELARLVSSVQLYRALGGGWQAEQERHPERYPMRREALDRIVWGGGEPQ